MANSGGNTTQTNILLNIGVQGQGAVQQATTQVQQLNNTATAGANINMAAPVRTLRQELRLALAETQRLVNSGQQNTQAFTQAASRVQLLRNQIEDTNRSIKSFDPENKFRVFANAASAGAKAVQGYTAAFQFLNIKTEDSAKSIAKLQEIMAFADAIDSLRDLKDVFGDLLKMLGLTATANITNATTSTTAAAANTANAAAQTANATANAGAAQAATAAAGAQTANATATAGATVATNAATTATEGFGLALKAIGIGIIIAAIVLLVENFSKIKKQIDIMLPGLGGVDKLFDKIKSTAVGMGMVVFDIFKGIALAITDLVSGHFADALTDLEKGFEIQKNFTDAYVQNTKEQVENARLARVKKEIEANTRIIAERKALGQNTYKLEVDNQRKKIETLDKDDSDYKKNRADAESELTVIINTERKKRSDKYKELLKADLDNIKTNNDAAKKVIAEGAATARDLELKDNQLKYDAETKLLEKRRKDIETGKKKDLKSIADYNKDFSNLTEARKLDEQKINKKYDDAIKAYDDETNSLYLTSYEKKAKDINKKADDLLKTASTPAQKGLIEQDRVFQLNQNTDEEKAAKSSDQAKTVLTTDEDKDRPKDSDTPDEARKKIDNLAKAKFDAENAAYELKKTQLVGQYDELAQLDADHQKTLTDNEEANTAARKAIGEKELDAKLQLYGAIGDAATTVSGIVGENTQTGKILAIASSSIATYSAIAKTLEAYAGIPIPGYAIAQSIAIGVAGFANIKKLIDVKVPGNSGGATSVSPPVINSSIITRDNNGTNDIRQTITNTATQSAPIRAYIVDKDLQKQQDKTNYYNQQSTI